jgi:enoyl-CoA hydratase/carnithine racemase
MDTYMATDPVPHLIDGTVLVSRHGAVLVIAFNRPSRLNAWTNDMEDAYFRELDLADADPTVRAIVITGAGRGFCSGADASAPTSGSASRDRTERPRSRAYPRSVDKPLIAAVNGAAAGIGLLEALYCDVRFCAEDAKLTTAFALRGLPAEYGMSWILPRIVGQAVALDLLLSGRVITGREAAELGLVSHALPADEVLSSAIEYATAIAERSSPASVAMIKRQVLRHSGSGFADAVAESEALLAAALRGPDVTEGFASFREKRAPQFAPLPAPGQRDHLGPLPQQLRS